MPFLLATAIFAFCTRKLSSAKNAKPWIRLQCRNKYAKSTSLNNTTVDSACGACLTIDSRF